MPAAYTTIAIASHQHSRNTAPKPRAPFTTKERNEKGERRAEKQTDQDAAVAKWISQIHSEAEDLGNRFGKDQRYLLDVLFQGGARMVKHQEVINPFNAWTAAKSAECREGMNNFLVLSSRITNRQYSR